MTPNTVAPEQSDTKETEIIEGREFKKTVLPRVEPSPYRGSLRSNVRGIGQTIVDQYEDRAVRIHGDTTEPEIDDNPADSYFDNPEQS